MRNLLFFLCMRSVVFLSFILSGLFAFGCSSGPAANGENVQPSSSPANARITRSQGGRVPVLVELFTSEGCPNCPPADRQLAYLETQQPFPEADVITLGFHVDYFNDRGWKDEFSLPVFTQRQNIYANRMGLDTVYTPQMVVDGSTQFVGSDAGTAAKAISEATTRPKGAVDFRINDVNGEVRVSGLGVHEPAAAVLVMAEDGLESKVNAGSNKGMTLQHVSVVRRVLLIGQVPAIQNGYSAAFALPVSPTGKNKNLRYIVYLQEDKSGRIIAVGRAKVMG